MNIPTHILTTFGTEKLEETDKWERAKMNNKRPQKKEMERNKMSADHTNMKIENVILLSMSTLPDNVFLNQYYYEADGEEKRLFNGRSQLTPDTKTILSILDSENKQIDRIVILTTKEARRKREVTLRECRDDHGEKCTVDAVSFYEEEIIDYVNKTESSEEYLLKHISVTPDTFITVDLDSEDTLFHAVKAIKGDGNAQIHLYINMQGGIRSTTVKMNAITELLESQNVKIMGRFANDYNREETSPYRSHSVEDEYKTYRLVTAMEMFKKFGRGEELKKYFDKYDDPFAKKLSNAIALAADSIQLCDVDGFDQAIDEIKGLDKEYEMAKVTPELQIIYQDIKDDYSSIINAKYRYVAQIRWCLEKEFIQQALTILESKMPDEYVLNGVIYFFEKGKEKKIIEDLVYIYEKLFVYEDRGKKKVRSNAYTMKNVNHFYVTNLRIDRKTGYVELEDKYKSSNIQIHHGLEKRDYKKAVSESYQNYKDIKNIRNEMNHAATKNKSDGFFNRMNKKRIENKNDNVYWNFVVTNRKTSEEVKEMVIDYLDQWEELAEQVPEEVVKHKVADIR